MIISSEFRRNFHTCSQAAFNYCTVESLSVSRAKLLLHDSASAVLVGLEAKKTDNSVQWPLKAFACIKSCLGIQNDA